MKCFMSVFFKKRAPNETLISQERLILQKLPNPEIEFVPAELITGIRDRANPYFWNHHGKSKESYIELAKKSEVIYEMWCNGISIVDIQKNEKLSELSTIYLSDQLCIKLYKYPNGKYLLLDDGRHRVAAAQKLNIVVPAKVTGEYKPKD